MKKTASGLAALLSVMMTSPAGAMPWIDMGPRAMGMGGAQVAIAQGPLAAYWNPAGLGQLYNTNGLEIPVGARFEFTGSVIQGAKDINQLQQDCAATPPTPNCTVANITSALSNLGQSGNGAMADIGGGVDLKFGRMVFFVNNTTYVGATPKVDMLNTGACQGAGCIDENKSMLVLRGGLFTDIGVGYGHEIKETGLMVGGNLKAIVGLIGYTELSVVNKDPGSGSFSNFKDNSATSIEPGVDLGALWDMRETFTSLPMRPRIGIVARNINNPTFKQPTPANAIFAPGNRYSLHGQTRMGVAVSPLKWWNVAADLDLTNNSAPIDGYHSRYLSLGTEVNVFNRTWLNIPLRVGLQNNLSAADSKVSYTGGFGLNFVHVMLDVAGMISSQSTTIQSQGESKKIPNNFGAAARFAFLFGGTDEGARNK
jgi:hypothetical protein